MERLDFNRSHSTQRLLRTGAAAHMSLHLHQQCQRAVDPKPRWSKPKGAPLYPVMIQGNRVTDRRDTNEIGHAAGTSSGEEPYMRHFYVRQWLFSLFPAIPGRKRGGSEPARHRCPAPHLQGLYGKNFPARKTPAKIFCQRTQQLTDQGRTSAAEAPNLGGLAPGSRPCGELVAAVPRAASPN